MNTTRLVLTIAGALLGLSVWGQTPQVIESFAYQREAEARKAWKPMGATAPVSIVRQGGHPGLRMPCNFKGTTIERASWDRHVALDLGSATGIAFEIFCRDASPISHFSIFFQSGDGWYTEEFFPDAVNGWQTIIVDKAQMKREGQPAGWGQIRTIRLSAWRGKDADTEFFIRDLRPTGILGEDTFVALIRGEVAGEQLPQEARSIEQACKTVGDIFERAGIRAVTLSDRTLGTGQLEAAKLVVLPYNPTLPEPAMKALAAYSRAGGKLLAFYSVPAALEPLFEVRGGDHVRAEGGVSFAAIRFKDNIVPGAPSHVKQQSWNIRAWEPVPGASRVWAEWLDAQGHPTGKAAVIGSRCSAIMTHLLLPDDADNKQAMLLAITAQLTPEIVQQAAQVRIDKIGEIASFRTYAEAARAIRQSANGARAKAELKEADNLRTSALTLVKAGKYWEATRAATRAQEKLREAFCLAQTPLTNEFRAFWCHSAFGVRGMTWDAAIRHLADNGFTAILPNMLWGGAAFYESSVLPRATEDKGDQIRECLAACRKYGVQMHVWKVNWNLGSAAPQEFVERMRREGRLQAAADRKEERWLCPSHPENQKLEVDSMLELARKYDLDGIHFDYIRYPDNDHCFCQGCRERFSKASGLRVEQWPGDILRDPLRRQQWQDWRRGHITEVVRQVSTQARAIRPGLKISAAVFSNWKTDRDSVAQDWKAWCEAGYLDFVCPMDYTVNNNRFENLVTQQLEWAGKTPCYPGIGVSASSSRFGPDRAVEQIQITRKHQTGGFIIFNYGQREAETMVPMLGLGITAR